MSRGARGFLQESFLPDIGILFCNYLYQYFSYHYTGFKSKYRTNKKYITQLYDLPEEFYSQSIFFEITDPACIG